VVSFSINTCYKDAFIDMVGNAYQVQSTQQKPRAQRTENSRYFMRLLSKTHLEIQTDSVADTFSLLMLFECQWGET